MVKISSSRTHITTEKLEFVDYFPSWVQDASPLSIHDVIKPLYYLSRLTNVWPYKYDSNNKITSLTLQDKLVTSVGVFTYILWFCWSLYKKSEYKYTSMSTALILADVIYLLFLHSFAVLSVVLMNSGFGELTKNFYLEYDQIAKQHKIFSPVQIYQRLRQKFLLETTIVICFGFGFHTFDIVFMLILEEYLSILFTLTSYIAQQMLLIAYCQITNKVELLFESFQYLNNKLLKSALFSKNKFEFYSKPSLELKSEQLKFLCQIHGQLCNLIHISNDMHGWQIVLMVFTVVTYILNFLYEAVTYSSSFRWSLSMIWIKFIISSVFYGALMIVLAARCSAARKQALKTGLLANEILLEMELDDTNKSALMYKERLQLLIGQISYRNPHFSAGGVFSVDYTTVSAIASAIASYLIMYIQFVGSPVCTFISNGTTITQVQ